MNSLLDVAIGAYLDSLAEREFDAPFMAVLRLLGFVDIHFLHGQYEFGKDFIAKRHEPEGSYQYTFQTKQGNITINDWRVARGQIDEMRTNNLAHPNFDTNLPRKVIFATTGRLVGGASLSAQEYGRHLQALREASFGVWDRDKFIEVICGHPELGLAGQLDEAMLRLVGEIGAGEAGFRPLEDFSRSWMRSDARAPWQSALVAAVIANRFRRAGRLDLAAMTALLLVRATAWHSHVDSDANLSVLLDLAGDLFSTYASELAEVHVNGPEDPAAALVADEMAHWVTYPVRCVRTAEILALHALRLRRTEPDQASDMDRLIVDFVGSQPGAAHPISDAWAASLIPIGIVLGLRAPEMFASWATEIARWVADYYESGDGLASVGASPRQEVDYLLGSPLEHVSLVPRSTSLIATALLDLVSILERGDLYDLFLNEFLAVNALPDVVEVPDSPDQYLRDSTAVTRQVNPVYDEEWHPEEGWRTAAHHRRAIRSYHLLRQGRAWEHLAISAVLRDRWFVLTMREFVTNA